MQTKTIKVHADEAKLIQGWLNSGKQLHFFGECDTIKVWTAKFDDNVEVDIKVVNSDSGPYVDAVMFEEGCEIGFLEVGDTLLGEYYFFDKYDSQEFTVLIEIA